MLSTVLRGIKDRLHARKDPVGFARSLGVQVGQNVRFYGVSRGMFSSEPWLIKLGSNVYITAGVSFVTHDGGTLILRKEISDLEWTAPIVIGDDVYIGIQSIILPGVKIGNRSIVAAGAVVSRDVPANSVVGGVPARHICTTDEYLAKMQVKSLKLGHLEGATKDEALREIFASQGWFDNHTH